MSRPNRIRVGAVAYLNSKPLVFDLERLAPGAEIRFDLPSRLAAGLASGELDVALVPSVELFAHSNYSIVSDACIACHDRVLSVKLLSRTPVDRIRTLALDEGSRTSAILVRILLRDRLGIEPELLPLAIGDDPADSRADAVLLIGDRAITNGGERFVAEWDLGREWFRWTGLPFVFAVWATRVGTELGETEAALTAARDRGERHLPEIAHREAAGVGLSDEQCLAYLRDNLHFRLGPRQREGLELFYRKALDSNLVREGWELRSYDCSALG